MSFKGHSSNSYEKRPKASSASSATTSRDSSTSDPTCFKLVMVGDSGVGKSCLLEKLLDDSSTNNFISTIGVDVRSHVVTYNGDTFKLQVWDTGGQQRYRPVLASCYRNANGVIVVYDVTNAKSFSNLTQWVKEVEEFTPKKTGGGGGGSQEGETPPPTQQQPPPLLLPPPPKLLVGNKSDLADRRQVDREKAERFAKENGMRYIETSAVETANIREAFLALVREKPASAASAVRF